MYLLYLSDVSFFLGKICKKFLKVNWDELTGIHHKSDTLEFIIRYDIIITSKGHADWLGRGYITHVEPNRVGGRDIHVHVYVGYNWNYYYYYYRYYIEYSKEPVGAVEELCTDVIVELIDDEEESHTSTKLPTLTV